MTDFLETLPPDLREAMLLAGENRTFAAGEAVFSRGDPGEALYVIVEGRVRVHDGDLQLNSLGAGEAFGEIAGLGGLERTASVTAEEDIELLRVEREALYRAVQARPDALRGLVTMLCERESGMADRMTSRSWELYRTEQELEIGRRIQSGFLPDRLPDMPGYEVAGHFQAARVVAGDFYDAFMVPSLNRMALVIGDVCDKGVGAALFMTLFRSLIRATAQSRHFIGWADNENPVLTEKLDGEDAQVLVEERLANTIALTNNYVATTHGKTSMFASVFVGFLDPDSGMLTYINAGHEEAFVIGAHGIRDVLKPTGPVIGIFAEAKHGIETTTLAPGEIILAYSDGVPEATNAAGEQFSSERLERLLNGFSGTAEQLIEMIINSIDEFTDGARQHDDITMLASRRETG